MPFLWSSVAGLALGIVYGGTMLNLSLRLTRDEFRQAGYLHMFCSYTLGISGSLLMLLNLLGNAGPGNYFLAMILVLMVSLIGFVTFAIQNFLRI